LFPELLSPQRPRKLKSAVGVPLITLSATLQKHHVIWALSRERLTITLSLCTELKGLSTPHRPSSASIA
jgi:hypothetical protein